MDARMSRNAGRATALAAALLSLAVAPASAAPGDNLRQFTAANPSNCGANVGIAFDGTNLLLTCLDNNGVDVVRTSDGSLVKTVTMTGHRGLAAAAWDAGRGRLWFCDAPAGNSPASDVDVWLGNTADGTSQRMFTSAGCHDGLAYDGSDDTLWTGPDVGDVIYHYRTDGTLIQQYSGVAAKLGGTGKSGIAVGGDKLFIANDGGSQIYTVSKDLSSSTLLATFSRRIEDLECDDTTFAPTFAIWSQDAFDRIINAYEIPSSSCRSGGKASTTPQPPPTTTPPPNVTGPKALPLPSPKKCTSRRAFPIRVRQLRGITYDFATVAVNGRRVPVYVYTTRRIKVTRIGAVYLNRKRFRAFVDLRGLAKGRYEVRVTAVTKDGQVLSNTRRYRTCTRRLAGGIPRL